MIQRSRGSAHELCGVVAAATTAFSDNVAVACRDRNTSMHRSRNSSNTFANAAVIRYDTRNATTELDATEPSNIVTYVLPSVITTNHR